MEIRALQSNKAIVSDLIKSHDFNLSALKLEGQVSQSVLDETTPFKLQKVCIIE